MTGHPIQHPRKTPWKQLFRSPLPGPAAITLICTLFLALAPGVVTAQPPFLSSELTYKRPPQDLIDLATAPRTPFVSVSPSGRWMLIMERPVLPGIAEVSQPELRLAGMRINPSTNGKSRPRGIITKLTLKSLSGLGQRDILGLPPGGKIGNVTWAPDGNRFAFTVTDNQSIELWRAEAEKESTKRIIRQPLNGIWGRPYHWLSDSKTLVVTIVNEERGPAPTAPRVPFGPVVEENIGKTSPARTYQDLLQTPYDKDLFDFYATSQLMRVDIDGKRKRIGAPGVYSRITPAPSGEYLLVERLRRPYSYLVRHDRFPRRVEIWDLEGNVAQVLVEIPLKDEVPTRFGSVPTGPRKIQWRGDAAATLCWVEAQDGGDPGAEAEIRDTVFLLEPPFDTPRTLIALTQRFRSITWGSGTLAAVQDWWWPTRNTRTWLVKPSVRGDTTAALLFDRSWEDRYTDPGKLITHKNPYGYDALTQTPDGKSLFLIGNGDSPEGRRPHLDRLDLTTHETTRLWQSQAPYYERPITLLDRSGARFITRRESRDDPPNYFLRTLGSADPDTLTKFPHPTPQLAGLSKEIIHYQREDGVELTATLYLPPDSTFGAGPYPTLFWAYPREFKSAQAAAQVTDSPYQFDRLGWWSPLIWVSQGYAVLDDPRLPIIGEGSEEPNDTFVPQLVAGAQAAVDEVVRRGVADPNRIAIGGHSYGAFMTANLLAHSDLFRAGIARSGAYNRTLTPFGFQREERTFWEAPEVYIAVSPFMHADKVDEPILLIHGDVDNNSGTFPMQSERFYNALKGHGATSRLVMLPHESHSYRARESILHMLWETHQWLETYVKAAAPRDPDGP